MTKTSNELYVALTRSTKELYIYGCGFVATNFEYRGSKNHILQPIRCIHSESLQKYARCTPSKYFDIPSQWRDLEKMMKNIELPTAVTKLVQAIPSKVKNSIKKYCLDVKEVKKHGEEISLVSEAEQTDGKKIWHESVADINGVVSVLCSLANEYSSDEWNNCIHEILHPDVPRKKDQVYPTDCKSLLRTAVKIQSSFDKDRARINQLRDLDWIRYKTIFRMASRIRARMPIDIVEAVVADTKIVGKIDNIYGDDIYEIKTTSTTGLDHHIQVAIYRYLYDKEHKQSDLPLIRSRAQKKLYKRYKARLADTEIKIGDHVVEVLADGTETMRHGFLYSMSDDLTGHTSKNTIVLEDGSVTTFYDTEIYEPYYVKPEKSTGKTYLYNCRDDSLFMVTIKDPELFGQLIMQKEVMVADDIFIERARAAI